MFLVWTVLQPNGWGNVGPKLLTEAARYVLAHSIADVEMYKTWVCQKMCFGGGGGREPGGDAWS